MTDSPPKSTANPTPPSATYFVPPLPEPGFIVKHWRGDYPLALSYWVFGSLLTLIVLAVSKLFEAVLLASDLGPRAHGTLILVVYISSVTITVWQFVGIWRSAGKHSDRGGKHFWAGAAKLMVIIAVLRTGG